MDTPTLDKYGLHPFGGYCTCYTRPWDECEICKAGDEQAERWKSLSPEERAKAEEEYRQAYPPVEDKGR